MTHLKFLKIFFLTLLMCLTFASGNASADAHTGGRFEESVQALDFPMMVLHKGGIVPRKGIEIKSF